MQTFSIQSRQNSPFLCSQRHFSYNGLLQGETEELPQIQEFAALSEKELDRIETLVQNLLKITKTETTINISIQTIIL